MSCKGARRIRKALSAEEWVRRSLMFPERYDGALANGPNEEWDGTCAGCNLSNVIALKVITVPVCAKAGKQLPADGSTPAWCPRRST